MSVRRYSLALIALVASLTACAQSAGSGTTTAPAVVAPAVVAPAVVAPAVVAAVVAAPATLRLAHHTIPPHPGATHRTEPHVTAPPALAVLPSAHVAPAPASASASASAGYPYRSATTQDNDAWGFTQRQCVSYVAWRLSTAGQPISNTRDGWGSALTWDSAARRLGFSVTGTPSVGAVAQWDAHESSAAYAPGASAPGGTFTAGGYGHVGYVTAIYPDGSVQVAQYNAQGDRAFSSLRLRAPRYLHVG